MQWLVTPQFFEQPEPALSGIVPEQTPVNGPHAIPDREAASLARVHQPIADFVRTAVQNGNRPVSVAGDCAAAIPVLAGLQGAGLDPVLVWIDAHGDFNTPETSPSQFLGGMPLAMMVGRGPQDHCTAVGLRPIAEDRVWLIDGRDLDPLERRALDGSAVRRTGIAGLASLRIDAPVHIHLDMDVLDSNQVPAFNYPVPDGPSVVETSRACRGFAAGNAVVAISVSGWTGALDEDGRTAAACKHVLDAMTRELSG